ncbi:MAG: hypothetical protein ACHP8A_13040 [Terriglobales bacterium]|jgi:hypothetical protein|nr:hypothetical protein [Terriglobales bacterium]
MACTAIGFSKSLALCLVFLVVGIAAQHGTAFAQGQPQRFWLAGRYDRNRVIVYFDAVKFNGTLPATEMKLTPVATLFFDPVAVSASFIAPFQKGAASERFSLGGHYDLLLEENHIATVALTTFVGCETDEPVGNDSYVGALATLDDKDLPYFREDYYVLRRYPEKKSDVRSITRIPAVWTRLENEPVEFGVQSRAVALLTEQMNKFATDIQRRRAGRTSRVFQMQAFRTADGPLRYYARAEWKPEKDLDRTSYALGAWISPSPELHILAIEKRTSGYEGFDYVLPNLINVVDLGNGKTGMIISKGGDDSIELDLVEYQDGADLRHMRMLQSIGTGE